MAIRVKDHDNGGKEIEIPVAEAIDGFSKGYFTPVGKVRVARGDKTGYVEADQIAGSLANGWRPVEDEEAQRITLTREESTAASQAIATLESAASGATLGLSDIVETELLGVDPARMAAREQAAGPLTDAAWLAGAVLPAALTGGASTGASGASLAGRGLARATLGKAVPAAGLEALGGLAERGVVRALGGGGLARATGFGVRGAVEGAGQEIGAQIHENVLGNREWNAELLSAGLNGGLLGGGIGVALPGLARMVGGKTRAPEAAVADVLARQVDGQPGNLRGISKAIAGGSGKKAEAIESQLGYVFGPKEKSDLLYRVLNERDAVMRESADEIVGSTNRMNEALVASRIETEGAFKRSNVARLLPEGADDFSPRVARERVRQLHPQIAGAQDLAAKYQGELHRADIDEVADRLRKLDADLEGASAVDAFVATQETARDIGEKIGKLKKTAFASRASERTLDEVRKIHRALRGTKEAPGILGDAAIWGDEVAGMFNEITTADAIAMQTKRGLIGSDGRGRNALGRLLDGSPTSVEDALAYAKQVGKPKGEVQGEIMDAAFQSEIASLRARAKHYDDPAFKQRLDTVETAYKDYKATMAKQSEVADLIDTHAALGRGGTLTGAITALGPSGAAITGGLLGGIPGAIIGAGLNMLARPQQMVRNLAGIRHLVDQVDAGIGETVGRFVTGLRGKSKAAKPARAAEKVARAFGTKRAGTRAAIAGAAVASVKAREGRQERAQTYQDRAALFASSPDALVRELGPLMYDVDQAAPGLAGHLQANVQRAAIFLAKKQPASYSEPFSPEPPIVDQVALDKYERYVEAVADPLAVLDRMADGTVTVEHAEALREVYPQIYQHLQGVILEELGRAKEEKRRIPFSKRIQIGVLFDIPADNSLVYRTPQAVPGAVQEEQESQAQQRSVRAHKLEGTKDKETEIGHLESGVA